MPEGQAQHSGAQRRDSIVEKVALEVKAQEGSGLVELGVCRSRRGLAEAAGQGVRRSAGSFSVLLGHGASLELPT